MNFPALASLYSRPRFVQMVLACTVAFLVPPWMNPPAQGQTVSDASRLGSFSGAMRYCEEQYGGSERRYRYARLRVAKVIDGMSQDDKRRARSARDRAYRQGTFLGRRLDSRQCKTLLEMSEWQEYVDR